jgi:HAD superfamily hydrolase (TIGR01509 family)
MRLEALIFDVDGTLAETEEAHREAFNDTFRQAGLPWHWDRERYRVLLGTTGGKERMRRHALETGFDIDDARIAALHVAKTERYGALIADGAVGLRPGIAALVELAQREGIRLAIATTTNRPNVDVLIRAAFGKEPDAIFAAIAAGDEVERKKPAPDVYRLALERLDLPAAACLAFEDSRNGLVSAKTAGIATLVAPSVYTSAEDFTGATAVFADFGQLRGLSHLAGLHAAASSARRVA